MKWPLKKMGDVFEIARGGSPRPIDRFITSDPDGVNWVMIGDATDSGKFIQSTKKKIKKEGVPRSRMVYPGDFLLTNSMSFGRPYIMQTTGCIHDGWLVLSRRAENVDSDFFFHLLGSQAIYAEFAKRAAGATVKNLNIDLVKSVEIPLPPLAEQKRIAGTLDAADALRAKRRAALAQLDALAQSLFLDLFGDPVTNPKGWEVVTIGDVVDGIESGRSPKCLERTVAADEWGVLKLGAVTYCVYRDGENKALPEDVAPDPAIEVRKGDVLFARKNTYELVAACAYVHETRPRLMLPDLIFRLGLSKTSKLEPIFIWQQLIVPKLRKNIQLLAGGAAGSMPNISKAKLRTVKIVRPPLPLQQQFAAAVEAIERQKARHREQLAGLDALFASLQHRAFRGEL